MKYAIIPNIHLIASMSNIKNFLNHLRDKTTQIIDYKFIHHNRSAEVEVKNKSTLMYIQKEFVKKYSQYITMYYVTTRSQNWVYSNR